MSQFSSPQRREKREVSMDGRSVASDRFAAEPEFRKPSMERRRRGPAEEEGEHAGVAPDPFIFSGYPGPSAVKNVSCF
jgi:hypothetical protein